MDKKQPKAFKEYNEEREKQKAQDVYNAIDSLRKSNSEITIASVCKKAKVSRTYIYKHPEMLETINKYRKTSGRKTIRQQDAKDALINSLKAENQSLKRKLTAVEINDNYKEKYESAMEENKRLQKLLDDSLANMLGMDC